MLQIIDYSEKAIAVCGDTREVKESLKALGGRFNGRLTCGAGWIFSAKKRTLSKYAPKVKQTFGAYFILKRFLFFLFSNCLILSITLTSDNVQAKTFQ